MCLATKTDFLKTQESFQLVNLILVKKKKEEKYFIMYLFSSNPQIQYIIPNERIPMD